MPSGAGPPSTRWSSSSCNWSCSSRASAPSASSSRRPALNLAHRWYFGYALDEDLPDHSSLTRIRQRLGIDVFQRFFEKIVDLCQEGACLGPELYFDVTKVEANAGIPSLIPHFYYEAKTHVADLFADEFAADGDPEPTDDDLAAGIVWLPFERNTEGVFAGAIRRGGC